MAKRQKIIPDNQPHFFEKGIIADIIGSTFGGWGISLRAITVKRPIKYFIIFCGFFINIFLKNYLFLIYKLVF
jgi:hypothetical protein